MKVPSQNRGNFTMISNEKILRNAEIPMKAKMLLCIMLSFSEDYDIYFEDLQKCCSEKEKCLYANIKVLEDLGYVVTRDTRVGGRFQTIYDVHEDPIGDQSTKQPPMPKMANGENIHRCPKWLSDRSPKRLSAILLYKNNNNKKTKRKIQHKCVVKRKFATKEQFEDLYCKKKQEPPKEQPKEQPPQTPAVPVVKEMKWGSFREGDYQINRVQYRLCYDATKEFGGFFYSKTINENATQFTRMAIAKSHTIDGVLNMLYDCGIRDAKFSETFPYEEYRFYIPLKKPQQQEPQKPVDQTPPKQEFTPVAELIKRTQEQEHQDTFVVPTLEAVKQECSSKGYRIKAETFFDYYTKRNWLVANGQKMSNWRLALKSWNDKQI